MKLESDLLFPELLAANNEESADIAVIRGNVSHRGLDGKAQEDDWQQSGVNTLWLQFPDVACFLIENGKTITYTPYENADDASIRLFILGSCIGAILYQRGFWILHGNAFKVANEAIICVGHSGAGKSTLAGAMLQRGFKIVADDVCAIDETGKVISGMPRIKLWKDAAERLGIETEGLKRIRPQLDKFDVPLGDQFCREPLPVKAVYVLNIHDEDSFLFEPVEGMKKFSELACNTYRLSYMQGMQLASNHLQQCAKLAKQSRVISVSRPSDGFLLDELVDKILQDVADHR